MVCVPSSLRPIRSSQKKLAADMLQAAGGLPISELERVGDDGSVAVRSFAAMKSIAKLNVASEAELRERRKQWTEADQRLGYSAVAALEQELAEQAGILGRVMLIARPSSVIEVAAKLHCLIVTHDPGLKLEDTPWPELRTILKDLIRIAGTRNPKPLPERLTTRSKPSVKVHSDREVYSKWNAAKQRACETF